MRWCCDGVFAMWRDVCHNVALSLNPGNGASLLDILFLSEQCLTHSELIAAVWCVL